MRSILCLVLCLVIFINLIRPAFADISFNTQLDARLVTFQVNYLISGDRVLIEPNSPYRFLFLIKSGRTVLYDLSTKTCILTPPNSGKAQTISGLLQSDTLAAGLKTTRMKQLNITASVSGIPCNVYRSNFNHKGLTVDLTSFIAPNPPADIIRFKKALGNSTPGWLMKWKAKVNGVPINYKVSDVQIGKIDSNKLYEVLVRCKQSLR